MHVYIGVFHSSSVLMHVSHTQVHVTQSTITSCLLITHETESRGWKGSHVD